MTLVICQFRSPSLIYIYNLSANTRIRQCDLCSSLSKLPLESRERAMIHSVVYIYKRYLCSLNAYQHRSTILIPISRKLHGSMIHKFPSVKFNESTVDTVLNRRTHGNCMRLQRIFQLSSVRKLLTLRLRFTYG